MIERRYLLKLDLAQVDLINLYYAVKQRGGMPGLLAEIWEAFPLEAKQALGRSEP